MKKIFLMMVLVFASGLYFSTMAQSDASKAHKAKSMKVNKAEKTFIAQADKALAVMEETAHKLKINGTAVVAFVPGEKTEGWISKMKVIGFFTNKDSNTLGVAYTKAAEMADTFKDSGSGVRKPLTGEFGWQGGAIKKVEGGYLLATFSGASGEQDFAVSTEGLNYLYPYFSSKK
ncbi:MAG TPA: hypothetical protein VGK10_14755 [Prolixibacteraceae bacterium]|jgi:hypothetical protein